MMRTVFKTSDVARILGVHRVTVERYADSKLLSCYRLPQPPRERRYAWHDVIPFLLRLGMEHKAAELGWDRCQLVVSPDGKASQWLHDARGEVVHATNAVEAAALIERRLPAITVVDTAIGRRETAAIGSLLAEGKAGKSIALVYDDEAASRDGACDYFDATLMPPFTLERLSHTIASIGSAGSR